MMDIEKYRLSERKSLFLVPYFITETLETSLLDNIEASKSKWTHVTGRMLQAWGGLVSSKGSLIPAPMPAWMSTIVNKVSIETALWGKDQKPNHVLVNKYEPGQGILTHKDGPVAFPATAILSLGSPAVMHFQPSKLDDDQTCGTSTRRLIAVALPPRSLLIFKDEFYENYCHGIEFVNEHRLSSCDTVSLINPQHADTPDGSVLRTGTRVSLTIRRVLKTQKNNLFKLGNTR